MPRSAVYFVIFSSATSSSSGVAGSSPQPVCALPQSVRGSTLVVTPMSMASALATWWRTLTVPAFQPKRPMRVSPFIGSGTRFTRPEMPSPSASCGSARAWISASRTASSRPVPAIGPAMRTENAAGASAVNVYCGRRSVNGVP